MIKGDKRKYADYLENDYLERAKKCKSYTDKDLKWLSCYYLAEKLNTSELDCLVAIELKKHWKKYYPNRFKRKFINKTNLLARIEQTKLLKKRIIKQLDKKNKFRKKDISLVLEVITENPAILLRKY